MAIDRVLFTVAGLQPEYGGPSRSVPALAAAIARSGLETELLTCESLHGQPAPLLPPAELVRTHLLPHASRTSRWLPSSNPFSSMLRERCRGAKDCVIHDHGLWLPTNHAAASAARALNVPRIVSPRGMLTAWALQHRGLKKKIAWALYQRRDLGTAQVLHATSAEEANAFRAAGLKQPVAMIPNGVELPPELDYGLRTTDSGLGTPDSGLRTLVFLGRLHPVKGLPDLARAWAKLRPAGWRVVIAGRDESGHRAEVEAELRAGGVEKDFQFVGELDGDSKWATLSSADLLVLPSHSENFGIAVAEALACGVPAIATRGTPWEDLVTHRCGWWCDNGADALAATLRDALARPESELREMGARGRALVETKYSWSGCAAQMLEVYRWMLGQGAKPDCVQ